MKKKNITINPALDFTTKGHIKSERTMKCSHVTGQGLVYTCCCAMKAV